MSELSRAEDLVQRVVDGHASEEEIQELESLMKKDESVVSIYLETLQLDMDLERNAEIGTAIEQNEENRPQEFPKASTKKKPPIFAIAAAIILLLFPAWMFLFNSYPDPKAIGTYEVVGGGSVQRSSTLVTREEPAQLELGDYCEVTVEPNTEVTIAGAPDKEEIHLEEGSVICEVEPGQGEFTVVTEVGTVSVLGTKFEVEIKQTDPKNMNAKQMLVKVLVGTVLVTSTTGQTQTLNAGDQAIVAGKNDPFTKGGYELVWGDEFEKDGPPDPKNWIFEEGFVRNNEAQWYQKENAQCKDGMLIITGKEDIKRNPGYVKGSTAPKETKFIEYTSSSILTKGLHSWTMGRFVMRAKIPHGEGMWPAFWTVGEHGEWPSNGEIDIMEYYQDKILANVASGTKTRWNAKWDSEKVTIEELGGQKWLEEFHVWRMDWDTESIRLYVDDRLVNETKLADTYNANTEWGPKNPFHHPQYIIINLALGGDNGGDMEKAKIPAEYIIDYVRVYQREVDKQFKTDDKYVPPPVYTGKRVGIHHFSELPKSVNKKCSWEAPGADSRCYAWKVPGQNRETAKMIADYEDKLEGKVSYKFVLNHGWSRWILEMNPQYGEGVADFSPFEKMAFAIKSKDAAQWEDFRVIIESTNGKSYEAPLSSLGFKPDGQWHRCQVNLNDVKQSGVDLTKIKTLFAIGWEGGVRNGQYYKLDDLHLE